MSEEKKIRRYFQDYVKWFPEEWKWELADDNARELYMQFRARRGTLHRDCDKKPYFDSIEKDANQFEMDEVEFTDIFGIHWKGSKGVHRYVGDADYDVHMYYYDPEDSNEEAEVLVSDTVTASEVPEGYAELSRNGVREYINIVDVVDVAYRYVVENHLFKDSYVIVSYGKQIADATISRCDDEDIWAAWDIHGMAKALREHKPELYGKFLAQVDEHFTALQNSDRDEERAFAPTDANGKYLSASEYFDSFFNNSTEEEG